MTQTFLTAMAGILLMPLIPAFILYKFLPSRTTVSGPFKGLDLKLTGAFSGYFLLVLVSVGVFFPMLKNEQQAKIDELERALKAGAAPATQNWTIMGHVVSAIPEQTKVFFDDEMPAFPPTGDFELERKCSVSDGHAQLPKWICVYNKNDGYKVINLNREMNSPDIAALQVQFNDSMHQIRINAPIDIQSKKNDSLKYVGTFVLRNPEVVQALNESKPLLLQNTEMLKAAVTADPKLQPQARLVNPRIMEMIRKP
ncbi:hypothetical protein ACTHGU_10755 [Chitinophagaceae bacterium MMS25-I14]